MTLAFILKSRLLPAIILMACSGWGLECGRAQPTPVTKTAPATAGIPDYDARTRSFFEQHCLECHGAENPKANLRLDKLSTDFNQDVVTVQLAKVLKRVQLGEMPPKSKPRPTEPDLRAFESAIQTRLKAGEEVRRAQQGRVVLRRLNRIEYENTIKDLLGIEVELQELLPADASANGFDNVGDAMHVSSFLMDRYLDAADKALNLAIANLPQPPVIKQRYYLKETHQVKSATENVFRKLENDSLVMFSSSHWQAITLSPFYPTDRGKYRFRISAAGFQSSALPVTFRIDAGPLLMATKNHLVGYFDAPADNAAVTEFIDHLEARSTIRISPFGLASAQEVHKIGADKYAGPGLNVEWVEVEGPLHDSWPPESHRRIFGDLQQTSVKSREFSNRVETASKDPILDARRVLLNFCRRAYRRNVSDVDVQPLVTLIEQKLTAGYSFEQAVRVGLKGALVSPEFLFLRERPGTLNDFALASRLSYFLWSTMPDEELLTLAAAGKLSAPEVLQQQVERLLSDHKANAFTENFSGQWLGLRDIDFTEPDRRLYPEYDDMLRAAIIQETYLFFKEVLSNNLSLANFVSSDFSILNERLARHYGIPDVKGHAFRKVSLPVGSHRGGVLSMSSVLKVTANGTTTSPVVRGAWVLDRILGTPPTPPPPGIAAVEPDIRGATTIREQLAKHRQVESCARCHRLIDPPGFALESFDVIGGWRENYRSVGNGEPVSIEGKRMPYAKGPKIDPADELTDGRKFANIDELKLLLLQDRDQLARALTTKLITYATGGPPSLADQPEIESIVGKIRMSNYGMRTLIHEIVNSRLFRDK
jgi:mono/diheme cytochrome c family protein